ncbi:MAG: hypothetical protein RL728_16 [Bacteroidota bacterium]
MFASGKVLVELEIKCLKKISKEITVQDESNFTEVREDFGVLIRDWDKNGVYPVKNNEYSLEDGWSGSIENSIDFSVSYKNTYPSPMNGYHLNLYSKAQLPVWYFGGTTIETKNLYNYLNELKEEPYINIFVKANDNFKSNAIQLNIIINEKYYTFNQSINWYGWKLVSFKLGDLKNAGNKLTVYKSINKINIGLEAGLFQSLESEVSYDFLFISFGKPLSNLNLLSK